MASSSFISSGGIPSICTSNVQHVFWLFQYPDAALLSSNHILTWMTILLTRYVQDLFQPLSACSNPGTANETPHAWRCHSLGFRGVRGFDNNMERSPSSPPLSQSMFRGIASFCDACDPNTFSAFRNKITHPSV